MIQSAISYMFLYIVTIHYLRPHHYSAAATVSLTYKDVSTQRLQGVRIIMVKSRVHKVGIQRRRIMYPYGMLYT